MRWSALMFLGLPLLAACAPSPMTDEPAMPAASGHCDAAPVQRLIGQRLTDDIAALALSLSGARHLRIAAPDSALTMDYREDRLTIAHDRNQIIERLTCG